MSICLAKDDKKEEVKILVGSLGERSVANLRVVSDQVVCQNRDNGQFNGCQVEVQWLSDILLCYTMRDIKGEKKKIQNNICGSSTYC